MCFLLGIGRRDGDGDGDGSFPGPMNTLLILMRMPLHWSFEMDIFISRMYCVYIVWME